MAGPKRGTRQPNKSVAQDALIRDGSSLVVTQDNAYEKPYGSTGVCLICGNEAARYILTKKLGKLMMTCKGCSTVIYVNSRMGDQLLRAWQFLLQNPENRVQIMTLLLLADQQLKAIAQKMEGLPPTDTLVAGQTLQGGLQITRADAIPLAPAKTKGV